MQARVSEFSAISGLLRKSDAEIAEEMSKVHDFKRLANQLAMYDDNSVNRIVHGLPPELRGMVKKMTRELQQANHAQMHGNKMDRAYMGRYVFETTHINFKVIVPNLILALILLMLSGYLV